MAERQPSSATPSEASEVDESTLSEKARLQLQRRREREAAMRRREQERWEREEAERQAKIARFLALRGDTGEPAERAAGQTTVAVAVGSSQADVVTPSCNVFELAAEQRAEMARVRDEVRAASLEQAKPAPADDRASNDATGDTSISTSTNTMISALPDEPEMSVAQRYLRRMAQAKEESELERERERERVAARRRSKYGALLQPDGTSDTATALPESATPSCVADSQPIDTSNSNSEPSSTTATAAAARTQADFAARLLRLTLAPRQQAIQERRAQLSNMMRKQQQQQRHGRDDDSDIAATAAEQQDLWLLLPVELWLLILSYLPGYDLLQVACVCSELYCLSSNSELWMEVCKRECAQDVQQELHDLQTDDTLRIESVRSQPLLSSRGS